MLSKKLFFVFAVVVVGLFFFQPQVSACTIFNSAEGGKVLVGNNEDWSTFSNPTLYFVPADQDHPYGRMVILHAGGIQGGMNDQGLFYDCNALYDRSLSADPFKETFVGQGGETLVGHILSHCATVQDVLAMLDHYYMNLNTFQMQWVDATGASVIIGYGDTGYTYLPKSEAFQVSTNFNLLTFLRYDINGNPLSTPDSRFSTATSWLTNWKTISENLFSHLLMLVSQTSTRYSNVCDLNNKIIYFHCHDDGQDFGNAAKVDLAYELAQGAHSTALTSLNYVSRTTIMPPGLTLLTPARGTLDVSPSANLVMKFPENVYEGSGYVTIKEYFTDDTVEQIDIGDATGFGTQYITINPSQNLDYDTLYYVVADEGCLVDAQSQEFHGILTKEGWRFKTAAQ